MAILQENDFAEREERLKKFWQDHQIYKFDDQADSPIYSVDTPPPYVSADHLHAGHILSYSQAEFIVRYKRMKGYNVLYPMGFDDNGLPTERYVEKKYNIDKSKITRHEFVKLCLEETKIGSQNYKRLWTDLGISVDWSKTYSTIDPLCRRFSQWSFIELYKQGKAYRKTEPMLWCTSCQTALAQAELEDKEVHSFLNYIDFDIEGKKYSIATTRPELIPACVALFANPRDERYKHLKGKTAQVPLYTYEVPIHFDETVSPELGTGLMMVCTWGDIEDIKKLREVPLKAREALNPQGKMTPITGKYQGMQALEARKAILEDLAADGHLLKQEPIKHVTNVHERCGTIVEFVPTTQWFIEVLPVKDNLIALGRELIWYPTHMRNMYEDWVNGLKWDWCISRQRYYGVPFPIWFCKECGEIIPADINTLPVDPTEDKPSIAACPACGCREFIPDNDVMDTWATSSCSPFIIPELIENRDLRKEIFPASLRPQAFEIIRTWIFYSMVKAYYHFGSIPFANVMISGHGLDEHGRKISKRLGNYIEPGKLLAEYSADAIRYWATGATLGSNHRFNLEDVKKGKHTVNKLWNAAKFCSVYMEHFTPDPKAEYALELEDKWILHELNKAIRACSEAFEKYEYAEVRAVLGKFFWGTFCDYYLEIIKHRATEDSAKYTMFVCLFDTLKLYAPILPFITEELYQLLYKNHEGIISIHKTRWPVWNSDWIMDEKEYEQMVHFLEEIDAIRKEKKEKRLRYKDVLDAYSLRTGIDTMSLIEKLKVIFSIREIYPAQDNVKASTWHNIEL